MIFFKAKTAVIKQNSSSADDQSLQDGIEGDSEEMQPKTNSVIPFAKSKSSFFQKISKGKSSSFSFSDNQNHQKEKTNKPVLKGDRYYSRMSNQALTEVLYDESDKRSFLFLLILMIAYYTLDMTFRDHYQISEVIFICILILLCILQFQLLHIENLKYIYLIQIVSSTIILVHIAIWVYYSLEQRQNTIQNAFLEISQIEKDPETVKEQVILSIQSEIRFFFEGAIVFSFQQCICKHLFPLYRFMIIAMSATLFILMFLWKHLSLDRSLNPDSWIKYFFLILIFAFSEYSLFKRLITYMISFQSLKKYYSLSVCSSSNTHGLSSNTLQIEINPQNLSQCKIISGSQGLSHMLLQNSAQFFQDFQIDVQSIQCFDSRGNPLPQYEPDEPVSCLIDNQEKSINLPQIRRNKPNNGLHKSSSKDSWTPSRQFIDTKVLKQHQQKNYPGSPLLFISNSKLKRTVIGRENLQLQKQSSQEDNEGKLSKFAPSEVSVNLKNKSLKSEIDNKKKKSSNGQISNQQWKNQNYLNPSLFKSLSQIIKDSRLRCVHLSGQYFNSSDSDKSVKYLSITLLKYFNLFQEEVVIASITDVTAIEEINNLQKEVQFKEKMFANVTHDLRTPLYAIMYSADKLKEIFQIHKYNTLLEQRQNLSNNIHQLSEGNISELHDQINITIANSHLMKAIIQDIIDNNRNRMGKLEPVIHQFDLMEIMNEMKQLTEILLWEKRKKIEIIFEVSKDIEKNSQILSDSQRLKQVLMNLISNSIKFTKNGGILIKVEKIFFKNTKNLEQYFNPQFLNSFKQQPGIENDKISSSFKFLGSSSIQTHQQLLAILQNGLIQFQVVDSGIGMDQKELDNLFTPYKTFNNDNLNNHGIGLGLTICKSIVEKLGPFSLRVASKVKKGAKFTFYVHPDLESTIIKSITPPLSKKDPSKQNIQSGFVNNLDPLQLLENQNGHSKRSDCLFILDNNGSISNRNFEKSMKTKSFQVEEHLTCSFHSIEKQREKEGCIQVKEDTQHISNESIPLDEQNNDIQEAKYDMFGIPERVSDRDIYILSEGEVQKLMKAPSIKKLYNPQTLPNNISISFQTSKNDQFKSNKKHYHSIKSRRKNEQTVESSERCKLKENNIEDHENPNTQTQNIHQTNTNQSQFIPLKFNNNNQGNVPKMPQMFQSLAYPSVVPSARCISTERHSPPVSSKNEIQQSSKSVISVNLDAKSQNQKQQLDAKESESINMDVDMNLIDVEILEEDEIFESSILIFLENNEERSDFDNQLIINSFSATLLPQADNDVSILLHQKANLQKSFQQKQISMQTPQAPQKSKKSFVESLGSEILDKRGLLLSNIGTQNHVTQYKMIDSMQLNQFKKLKYGQQPSHENEDANKITLNVMICDDSSSNVEALKRVLLLQKEFKMKVDCCYSGDEAIKMFQLKNKPNSKEPYNYIFLDWNMPIMDGYETSSRIKFYVKDEQYLDCPIIICSAYDDNAEINKCLRNGIDAILPKPVFPEALNKLLLDCQKNQQPIRGNQFLNQSLLAVERNYYQSKSRQNIERQQFI